ncbi:PLP-dependent aminotransferase family protein [Aminivibrio sp.]|jgi:DNA-binding transcriptional MocR family regulator|uniref:aminotransferase-like domain-containing protein n=1 Tax=Aminivibrio sp. TaxID=1872489 RepID=UPI001A5228D3|nr:PLP-dependent aminotransferase family protein [Aminivibrio sp.]MBL3539673.1 PLP-dependent aminotransferase family protein [Aminivibrio sp.]MDK2958569.1 GntR family transcriptional regulator / MocR family aminotransferase [Synergistaceae bacterium]
MLLEIPLDSKYGTLYRQIAEHLEKMILAGSIPCGTRLPGTRELARMLGVSRSTVVEAYMLLEKREIVQLKGRSGAFAAADSLPHPVSCREGGDVFHFDSERPTTDLIPYGALAKISRDALLEDGGKILGGSPPEGLEELRFALLEHSVLRGIPARPGEMAVTSGGKDALSTVLRALRTGGYGRVFAERLTYTDMKEIAANEGLPFRPVPLLVEEGLASLKKLTSRDILYLIPSFQNPTGMTLPPEIRREILELRQKKGFLIIEDDSYGELRYGEKSVPALKALDEGEGVVYIGSFSQVLFPGMRFGYILLPSGLWNSYVRTASFRQGQTSSLVQLVMLKFIRQGKLAEAVEKARAVLSARMESLLLGLGSAFPGMPVHKPEGGVFLWFPTGKTDGREAAGLAFRAGVLVTDGNLYSLGNKRQRAVRFSVSSVPAQKMDEACARLEKCWTSLF